MTTIQGSRMGGTESAYTVSPQTELVLLKLWLFCHLLCSEHEHQVTRLAPKVHHFEHGLHRRYVGVAGTSPQAVREDLMSSGEAEGWRPSFIRSREKEKEVKILKPEGELRGLKQKGDPIGERQHS